MNSSLKAAERVYGIKASWVKVIVLAPAVIVVLYIFSLSFPPTRSIAILTTEENNLVETLTFVFLLLGGVLGLVFVWRTRKRRGTVLVHCFYTMLSIILLVIAAEEVAWGQMLFHFETPTSFGAINRQDETTLHNIGELNGHSEVFRLAAGLSGLLAVLASSYHRLRNVGAPAILLPWFSIIAVVSSVDLYADFFPFHDYHQLTLDKLSEVIEMMIGASGLLFVWLNTRMLSFHAKGSSRSQGPTHP